MQDTEGFLVTPSVAQSRGTPHLQFTYMEAGSVLTEEEAGGGGQQAPWPQGWWKGEWSELLCGYKRSLRVKQGLSLSVWETETQWQSLEAHNFWHQANNCFSACRFCTSLPDGFSALVVFKRLGALTSPALQRLSLKWQHLKETPSVNSESPSCRDGDIHLPSWPDSGGGWCLPGTWRQSCRCLLLGPMLFFYNGISCKARGDLESISHDDMAFTARMKDLGIHMCIIFFLILSTRGNGFRRSGWILQLHVWLCLLS